MGRLYLIVIVAAGLFGAFANRLHLPESRPSVPTPFATGEARVALQPGDGDSYHDMQPSRQAGETIIRRGPDGHFYADVTVNGTILHMLVDTGASTVALSRDDARRAGIATSIGAGNEIGQGAGGAVFGDVARLDSVKLGMTEIHGLPAVVLTGGSMSLLGQSFLREFGSVEIKGDQMILKS